MVSLPFLGFSLFATVAQVYEDAFMIHAVLELVDGGDLFDALGSIAQGVVRYLVRALVFLLQGNTSDSVRQPHHT
jgi:hypothetical protein